MFEAGGFGVALTVTSVDPPLPEGPVAARRARLTDYLEPRGFDDEGVAAELARIADARAQLAAYEVALVVRLAELRPDHLDLRPGSRGAAADGWVSGRAFPGVSESFVDELALLLNCSRRYAQALADTALVLVRQLPATWVALADGAIDWPRAGVLTEVLGWQAPHVPAEVVAECEAELLADAADMSVGRLRARAWKVLLRRDAAAADRRRAAAERAADVRVGAGADGMARLEADLPTPLAQACRETVDAYARMAKADGDPRPIGQLRAGVLADLVLRPWDDTRPPVTAQLTVLAPLPTLPHPPAPRDDGAGSGGSADEGTGPAGGGELGEVGGEPITAAHLRELLGQLDALCPAGLQAPAGGSLHIALVDPDTGALRATVSRAELERLAHRDCPAHPPPGAARCCAVLDRPPPVDRYTPSPAQRRFVAARDRTCRHPGCARSTAWTDADHVIPHAVGGGTDCENLCCLCRRHHRLKTHAPGWRFVLTPEGVLSVTTPSGVTRVTRPPGMWMLTPPALTAAGEPPPPDDPPPF